MTRFALLITLATTLFAAAQGVDPSGPPAEVPADNASMADDGVRVAVLGYHDFSETLPKTEMRMRTSDFRAQMATIRQIGLSVITLDDFLAWKRGEKAIPKASVLITLDDGWKSVYSDAFPILKEFGYPFTLFLYKNYIDGGGKALTTAMIQDMIAHGASIGSHSVSHPYPATIRSHRKKGAHDFDAFLRKEMGESKRFLEEKFSATVTAYAYPGGFHTDEMSAIADEFHYSSLFTVIPGKVKRATPDKTLPRYMILGTHPEIFNTATNFLEGQPAPGSLGSVAQTTPYPVVPEAGAIVNSRLPLISADLSSLADFDPKSLVMKVSGFGEVPAKFDPATKHFSWQTTRRLRQPTCLVTIIWKDSAGKAPDTPLRWSFQLDREAAYLPESE